MKSVLQKLFLTLVLASAAALFSGCATEDPNNLSTMPWDKAASWEGPMPSTMNQGR
jgi:type IV pilus biogenesis protein CpaD/CtpE